MLRQLMEYTERLALPPPLYAETPIRYVIALDGSGRLLSRAPLDTAEPSIREARHGVRRQAPQVTRTVGIKPLLLADHSEYTFGLARDASRQVRARNCHTAYMDLSRGAPRQLANLLSRPSTISWQSDRSKHSTSQTTSPLTRSSPSR